MLNKTMRITLPLVMLVCASLITALPAMAHKIFMTAWVEEDSAFLEAGFGDGSLAKNAEVTVFDDVGNELLKGKTNDQGEYSFKIPKKCALKLKVNAGMGHQTEAYIPLEDVQAAFPDEPSTAVRADQAAQPASAQALAAPAGTPAVASVSAKEIERIVEKSLDKKLKPIIRRLAQKEDVGPEFKDIAGGIGYILGLVGLGAYFNYRKRKED